MSNNHNKVASSDSGVANIADIMAFESEFWSWLALIGKPFSEHQESGTVEASAFLIASTKSILPANVFAEYIAKAESVIDVVREEIYRRFEAGESIFTHQSHYDMCGDDKLFMDLPAHITAMGRKTVIDFLENGALFPEMPIECFAYIFQPYQES